MEQFILPLIQKYELDVTVSCYFELDWTCMWQRGLPEILITIIALLGLILLIQLIILPIFRAPGIARRLVRTNRGTGKDNVGTRAADVFCDAWEGELDYNEVYTEALADITSNKIAGEVCKVYLMPLGLAAIHTDDHEKYKVRTIHSFRNKLIHRFVAILRWLHKQK